MEQEISRKTLTVLVVLSLVLSAIGMWNVVISSPSYTSAVVKSPDTAQAKVTIKIVPVTPSDNKRKLNTVAS